MNSAGAPTSGSRGLVAIAVLVALAGVNAIQFAGIDSHMTNWAAAYHRYDSPDLFAAGLAEDPNARSRYDFYVRLGEIAPRSSVLIPSGGAAEAYRPMARLIGIGDVEEVAFVDLDASGFWAQVEGRGEIVADGRGGARGAPWVIIVDQDGALAESGEPREWVWVLSPQARAGSPYWYQNLLIEASLLGIEDPREVDS